MKKLKKLLSIFMVFVIVIGIFSGIVKLIR